MRGNPEAGVPVHRQPLLTLLDDYGRRFPGESALVRRFCDFVAAHPTCFERDCWAGHVTGSAWLLNGVGDAVLLTHHRKLRRWLQPGGHCDGDSDVLQVALREAEEESGLVVTPRSERPLDIDIHPIPARGTDPEHHHFDVRFVLQVATDDDYRVSDESIDLAWVPLDLLDDYTREESVLRLRRKWLQEPPR